MNEKYIIEIHTLHCDIGMHTAMQNKRLSQKRTNIESSELHFFLGSSEDRIFQVKAGIKLSNVLTRQVDMNKDRLKLISKSIPMQQELAYEDPFFSQLHSIKTDSHVEVADEDAIKLALLAKRFDPSIEVKKERNLLKYFSTKEDSLLKRPALKEVEEKLCRNLKLPWDKASRIQSLAQRQGKSYLARKDTKIPQKSIVDQKIEQDDISKAIASDAIPVDYENFKSELKGEKQTRFSKADLFINEIERLAREQVDNECATNINPDTAFTTNLKQQKRRVQVFVDARTVRLQREKQQTMALLSSRNRDTIQHTQNYNFDYDKQYLLQDRLNLLNL